MFKTLLIPDREHSMLPLKMWIRECFVSKKYGNDELFSDVAPCLGANSSQLVGVTEYLVGSGTQGSSSKGHSPVWIENRNRRLSVMQHDE